MRRTRCRLRLKTSPSGKANFSHYCVACHGLDGQNTGVPFAENMAPPVPSLASANIQSYTDGQLKWVIDNGIFPSGMPASKGILTDEEIWSNGPLYTSLAACGKPRRTGDLQRRRHRACDARRPVKSDS